MNLVHVSRCTTLFVSTSLDTWTTGHPEIFARDVQINDTAYRRLDPEYYAWLRSRMNLAKLAAGAGRLSQDAFDELREKFNAVHEWAVGHFGEDKLRESVRNLDTRNYAPPVAEPDKPVRPARAAEHIASDAVAMVDAIRDRRSHWAGPSRAFTGPAAQLVRCLEKRVGSRTCSRPPTRSAKSRGNPSRSSLRTACASASTIRTSNSPGSGLSGSRAF